MIILLIPQVKVISYHVSIQHHLFPQRQKYTFRKCRFHSVSVLQHTEGEGVIACCELPPGKGGTRTVNVVHSRSIVVRHLLWGLAIIGYKGYLKFFCPPC